MPGEAIAWAKDYEAIDSLRSIIGQAQQAKAAPEVQKLLVEMLKEVAASRLEQKPEDKELKALMRGIDKALNKLDETLRNRGNVEVNPNRNVEPK
jgi:soluble cytochrome b562